MASRVSSPTFIGRRGELDRVAAAIDEARLGHPSFLLVAGEAGVGKTRFVREIERSAVGDGVRVLEGGCLPLGGEGLPFGAVIEALRGLTLIVDRGELEAMAGTGRAELARLMPELAPVEAARTTADGSEQGRLFEHLLHLLAQLGERGPVALVLEDIHWADRSTLELLGFLARNLRAMPVVLLATYRTDELHRGHPLPPLLAELDRSGQVERLSLARFDRHEVAGQLEGILGVPPEPGLLSRIAARSEGNAFYAEELLAAGSLRGELPATLREVLLARLAVLSEPTQELLRVASAAGQRIASARLAAVTGISDERLEGLLREAVENQILVVQDRPVGARLIFRHALVQEAVYGELLPEERTRLHASFARAIADEGRPEADASRAAEIAYHWQAAHDLPRAFDAWIEAGIAAEALYASAEAREDFEHALELWDQVPDASARAPLDRVELLMRAAFHAEGPEPARSVAYIEEAIGLVDAATDPTRAGLLYERLGQYSRVALDGATALAAYQEAVRLVPTEPPSADRSWVLSGLGAFYAETDRPVEAVGACEEALSVARAAGARHVETRALVPLGRSQVLLGDVETGLATLRQARELAMDLGDVHEVAKASTMLARAMFVALRWPEAAAAGLEAAAYASSHGLGARWAPDALFATAGALFFLGGWDEAAEALTRAQRYELHGWWQLQVEAQLLLMEALRGQFESANRRAPRVRLLAERFASIWQGALAVLALWQNDPLAARAAVVSMTGHPDIPATTRGFGFMLGIQAEADLAALARSRHSDADLEESRARGADYLARMRAIVEDGPGRLPSRIPWVAAPLATSEAEFSRLEGTPDPDLWASAAAAWESFQMTPNPAYARMREAEATLAAHGDRSRAARALNEAHRLASAVGAMPLRRQTEALAARAGIVLEPVDDESGRERRDAGHLTKEPAMPGHAATQVGTAGGDRDDLTQREREVLALVGQGRSNTEIGEILYISKKTVSVHVANIKAKLGASSRVEIAIHAIEMGLVETPAQTRA